MAKIKEEKASQEAAQVSAKPASEDYFADFDFKNLEITLEQMLKAGVHFGHKSSRHHPRMDEYIFTTRKGINIIDLERTLEKLEEAMEFIKSVKKEGKKILFVGTKKQVKDLVKSAAARCEMPYVVERWLGGTFTNFKAIKERVQYFRDLEEKLAKGEFAKYTKFEQMKKKEEQEKLERKLGGIKNMDELPGVILVADAKEDALAIKEAGRVGIPIVALADTNVDPSAIDYPIPANDDAISAVRLILGYLCKAILETEKLKN